MGKEEEVGRAVVGRMASPPLAQVVDSVLAFALARPPFRCHCEVVEVSQAVSHSAR